MQKWRDNETCTNWSGAFQFDLCSFNALVFRIVSFLVVLIRAWRLLTKVRVHDRVLRSLPVNWFSQVGQPNLANCSCILMRYGALNVTRTDCIGKPFPLLFKICSGLTVNVGVSSMGNLAPTFYLYSRLLLHVFNMRLQHAM